MSYKPIEPKRDEFRKYLESNAVIDTLTKVFAKLLDEEKRPDDPLEYIRENLGRSMLQHESVEYLRSELKQTQEQIVTLQKLLDEANARLDDKTENDVEIATNGGHAILEDDTVSTSSADQSTKENDAVDC